LHCVKKSKLARPKAAKYARINNNKQFVTKRTWNWKREKMRPNHCKQTTKPAANRRGGEL